MSDVFPNDAAKQEILDYLVIQYSDPDGAPAIDKFFESVKKTSSGYQESSIPSIQHTDIFASGRKPITVFLHNKLFLGQGGCRSKSFSTILNSRFPLICGREVTFSVYGDDSTSNNPKNEACLYQAWIAVYKWYLDETKIEEMPSIKESAMPGTQVVAPVPTPFISLGSLSAGEPFEFNGSFWMHVGDGLVKDFARCMCMSGMMIYIEEIPVGTMVIPMSAQVIFSRVAGKSAGLSAADLKPTESKVISGPEIKLGLTQHEIDLIKTSKKTEAASHIRRRQRGITMKEALDRIEKYKD